MLRKYVRLLMLTTRPLLIDALLNRLHLLPVPTEMSVISAMTFLLPISSRSKNTLLKSTFAPSRSSGLRELQRQSQLRNVSLFSALLRHLDTCPDLAVVAAEVRLLDLEVLPQVEGISLEIVDEAREDAEMRLEQVHLEFLHHARVRELPLDVLHDNLRGS
jgi:hypothetical protein